MCIRDRPGGTDGCPPRSRCSLPPTGGAISPLGRPGGTDGCPPRSRCSLPPTGGAISPLGRPGGTDMGNVIARAWEVLTRRIDSMLFGAALAIVGVGLV